MSLVPVTGKLLVEGGLAVTGFVALKGPEAAAVGRQHLVAENDAAALVETVLEFGVGDNDAL